MNVGRDIGYFWNMRNSLTLAAASILAASSPVGAQGARTVDQGSFTVTTNGRRTGREDFTIAATPSAQGTEYIAKATIVSGNRRLNPAMQTDSSGTAMTYQIETRSSPTAQEWWSGTISRGRVDARMRTAKGEARKEYIVTEGALVLDDDVFHQYYFVALREKIGTVAILIPHRNAQMTLRIKAAGPDVVTIGGKDVESSHLVLTEPDGTQRDLWVDAKGRVLKVAIPSRGVVAIRDDPPAN